MQATVYQFSQRIFMQHQSQLHLPHQSFGIAHSFLGVGFLILLGVVNQNRIT